MTVIWEITVDDIRSSRLNAEGAQTCVAGPIIYYLNDAGDHGNESVECGCVPDSRGARWSKDVMKGF